jgi:DNA-binding transcriptional LysR family regulator
LKWAEYQILLKQDKVPDNQYTFNLMLKIRNLQDLQVFVQTAESGSLTAAARQLELSPAVASASTKRLEDDIGTVLFFRTTRSLRLSQEGQRFLPAARLALSSLGDAVEEIAIGRTVVRDTLQLSMPSDLGRNRLLDWIDRFQLQYPEVSLRVEVSDRPANLYRQSFDLAIRYGAGSDSGLVAIPLAPDNRRVLCASPDYLARNGTPEGPTDLSNHNCLRYRLSDEYYEQWRFEKEGQTLSVAVRGNRLADDGEIIHRWALAGLGIAYKSFLDVEPSLANGRLVRLCPDWITEAAPLSLVCADRRQMATTVVLLRDHLRQCLGA